MNSNSELRALLYALEAELKQLNLWQSQPPNPAALASTEPFCIDTLSLTEWLQWLAIPRLHALLDGQRPLPKQSNIHAMAEESFTQLGCDHTQLLAIIARLDATICAG